MSWEDFLKPPTDEPVELGTELGPLVQLFSTKREPPLVRTHLKELNEMVLGLYPGEVTILAARPSQGKSSLALDIFLDNALSNRVYLFSLEMSKQVVLDRLLCNMANVSLHRLRAGMITQKEENILLATGQTLKKYRGWIDDSSSLSLRTLRTKLTAAVAKGTQLAIIDYVQLMTMPTEGNEAAGASKISSGIRAIAKDLQVPILLLSQLNREVEKRGNWGDGNDLAPRPKASDLYGGALEMHADGIWLIYRPTPTASNVELIVAKNRNGLIGSVPMTWHPEYTSFRDSGGF
jgi:replicative DNA helicase